MPRGKEDVDAAAAAAGPVVHKPVGIKAGLFPLGLPTPPLLPPPLPPPELKHRLTAFLQKNYAATQHLSQQLHHLNTLSLTRQACSLLNKVKIKLLNNMKCITTSLSFCSGIT